MPAFSPKNTPLANLRWRVKALLFLAASAVVFIGVVVGTQKWVVLPRIEHAEVSFYADIAGEISSRLDRRLQEISGIAADLASRNSLSDLPEYWPRGKERSDLPPLLLPVRPTLAVVFDLQGRIVSSWAPERGPRIRPEVFRADLARVLKAGGTASLEGHGGLALPSGLLLYARHPYLPGGQPGEPRGVVFVGEFLPKGLTASLGILRQGRFSLVDAHGLAEPLPGQREVQHDCYVAPVDDDTMVVRIVIPDDQGKPAAAIELRTERLLRLAQVASMRLTIGVMFAATLVLCLVIWILVDLLYVGRIERLIGLVGRLEEPGVIDELVAFEGRDEVALLARRTGLMVRNLWEARSMAVAADQAKTNFLAMMSHELRTPMNGVIGFAGLMADTRLDAEQHEYVRIIDSSARAMLKQIDEILHYSMIATRGVALDERPVRVREILKDSGLLILHECEQKKLAYEEFVDPAVPQVLWIDAERLRQVLANLLQNAVKFTRQGVIRLRATVAGAGADGQRSLCISVEDTGIGIAKEQQANLFKPFTQADAGMSRRYSGTGLGLVISQRVVQAMGGRITLESELGRGAVFTVCLPLRESEPARAVVTGS